MSAIDEEMVCEELVRLVTEYVEGTLSDGDRRRLQRHLAECPWCVDYVKQHREIVDALGHLDDGDQDEEVWAGLLSALRERGGNASA